MTDYIKRADAVGIIEDYIGKDYMTPMSRLYSVRSELLALPSADAVSREAHYDAIANRITDMEERGFVSVVRCKDCRYFKKIVERSDSGLCHRDLVASAWKENGYCSRGERQCNYFGERREP